MLRREVLWAAIVWVALLLLAGHCRANEEAPDAPLDAHGEEPPQWPPILHYELRRQKRERRQREQSL